ncbi:hypothetical protein V1292_004134 [Bradyrhizobium sp. AZCC 1719]|uniref:DUF1353 domain-containing protein n=1 Tax=Bradyrhizobium sp. AZCC 1719 TaxID=3117028 RepID=UPI002FF41FEB
MDEDAKQQFAIEREKVVLQTQLERKRLTVQNELEREKLTVQKELEWQKLADQKELEREKLTVDRLKSRLDFKKFILGSVFVAVAIAAIPPLFQLATAVLEYTKSTADRLAKQQALRDDYNKDFINNALNQDIELRIRFSQYLANVSSEPNRPDWLRYHKELKAGRDTIRIEIDKMEARWRTLSGAKDRDEIEIAKLERNLDWAYKEVGYVPKNRSAVVNPRAPEPAIAPATPIAPTSTLFIQPLLDQMYVVSKPFIWVPKADQGKKYEPVIVPAGFVLSLDIVPKVFWALLSPDSNNAAPTVLLQFLYWDQNRSREVADDIFRIALEESGASTSNVTILYQSVRRFGQAAWDENARQKAQGEKRILKEIPTEPAKWADLKQRPENFQ